MFLNKLRATPLDEDPYVYYDDNDNSDELEQTDGDPVADITKAGSVKWMGSAPNLSELLEKVRFPDWMERFEDIDPRRSLGPLYYHNHQTISKTRGASQRWADWESCGSTKTRRENPMVLHILYAE